MKEKISRKCFSFKTVTLILLVSLGLLLNLYAENSEIKFEHITVKDGLSQAVVTCIYQDSRGFMWFGTEDGLNKYDGYNYTIYTYNPFNPNSLSMNQITCIIEDSEQYLWIGTGSWLGKGHGLNRFDRKTEKFTRFIHDPSNSHSLSHDLINCLYEDQEGWLWIGTEGGGLNRWDRKTEKFTHYKHDPNNSNSLSSNYVTSICEDRSGILWIGTRDGGLNAFDRETTQFSRFISNPRNSNSLSSNYVFCIHKDREDVLWIGTDNGFNRFDPITRTFIQYKSVLSKKSRPELGRINEIGEDDFGQLWLGSSENGIYCFDKQRIRFIQYIFDPDDPIRSKIESVYVDRSGTLWVGTNGAGINRWNPYSQKLKHYKHDPNNPKTLGFNQVRTFDEDRDGVLWIGGYGNGLDRFDRKTGEFTHFFGKDIVWVIVEDREEPQRILWIGKEVNEEVGGGLCRFDRKTGDCIYYPLSWVRAIHEDQSHILWIGTDRGLNRFNKSTGEFTLYQYSADNPSSLSHNTVTAIHEDTRGILWIGTMEGLNRFDREKESFTRYQNEPKDPNSLSYNIINSIHEDKSGNLWIGTGGGGLNKFDRDRKIFTCYTVKDGLPNNVVYGILEDRQGNLWLSTNKGISKFNPLEETFRNYDEEDGIQDNEFNTNAYYKSKSGEMFFGGVNGFNVFHPDSIMDNPHAPQVEITDFQLFNKSVPIGKMTNGRTILEKSISESESIELSYRDKVFSFQFAALHYANSKKNKYACMMEGFDKEWRYTDADKRLANYTNLDPGNYIFRVKGANSDGIWNEEETSLKIKIIPPFWQTLWFRAAGIAVLFLIIIGVFEIRAYDIKKRNKELERRVQERTSELERSNAELDEFAFIISHDLKAPLRAVSQLAKWISEDYADALGKDGKEQMNLLIGRVKRMDNLINGVLEYSRAGRMKEEAEEIDLNSIAEEAIEDVAPPDNIRVTIENKLPVVMADRVRIKQVFQNLISNAIKFMDKPKGEIKIGCVDEETHWKISIADNGPGIDEKFHDKIFQIFQTIESSDKCESTGIGLSVVKKIVELYGGKIWVESKVGEGSSFFFTLKKREGEGEK